jgi:hypothetical protein
MSGHPGLIFRRERTSMPPFSKFGNFGKQVMDVEHHAIADVALDAVADDARRHQIELVDLLADDQRMTGIVAALKAHHPLGMIGQPVDDLALPLVAPLGAHHDDILGHFLILLYCFNNPVLADQRQLSVAERPFAGSFARQQFDDDLALFAQRSNMGGETRVMPGVRRKDGAADGLPAGARRATSRRSIEKPVAGRARPKALPAPS